MKTESKTNNAEVQNFLTFCNKIQERAYWKNTKAKRGGKFPQAAIQELKEQNEDHNLYLGVIGEFSSGKSTLINAILHQNLLKKDVNPTTSTPTFIRYGDRFNIVIDYSSGKKVNFWDECKDADLFPLRDSKTADINDKNGTIRQFISKYTASEDISKGLDRVTIYLNNPFLKNGLVIVDTPGINAGNYKRHEDVTKETIKKYCDAVIIITKASNPCEKTLCEFVNDCVSGLEDRCIGVVSQIDEIGDCDDLDDDDDIDDIVKEQNLQLKTAQKRFDSMLKKSIPVLLPVSARYAEGKSKSLDNPRLLEHYKQMFSQFMETIHQRMVMGREKILAQSMHSSILETVAVLQKRLAPLKDEFKNRSDELKGNKLSNLDKWYASWKKSCSTEMQKALKEYDFASLLSNIQGSIPSKSSFNADIDVCDSIREIKNCVSYIQDECDDVSEYAQKEMRRAYKLFSKKAQSLCKDFLTQFTEEYRNLTANVDVPQIKPKRLSSIDCSMDVPELSIVDGGFIDGLIELIDNPLISWMYIDQAKNQASKNVSKMLRSVQNKLRSWLRTTTANIKQFDITIFAYTDQIVEQYEPTITEIILQERSELRSLQNQVRQIENDLKKLHQFEQGADL